MAWHRIAGKIRKQGEAFFDCLNSPGSVQAKVLDNLLQRNANTVFGRRYGFSGITGIAQYRDKVPLHSYEKLLPYIDRIISGETDVLSSDPVTLLEQTGGTSGGVKTIPYNHSALQAFQKAIIPWLYDLLKHRPGIAQGKAYWSISPAVRRQKYTAAGVPLGMANDADYFGPSLAMEILNCLAVPPQVGAVSEFSAWQYITLRCLLASSDLSFISVWSPTFLLALLEAMKRQAPRLLQDIEQDQISISLPKGVDPTIRDAWRVDDARFEQLSHALTGDKLNTRELWPQLDTISCWLDANAARYAPDLAGLFPSVHLQGKGLLATEGVVSIPVQRVNASVLALDSGIYEFIDARDNLYLVSELVEGETYRVVMSTYSGFYRYDLGDRVTVCGFLDNTPLLRFEGRDTGCSDMCGEKLTEEFVRRALAGIAGYAMLLACQQKTLRYRLVLDGSIHSAAQAQMLAADVDQFLRTNPQYAYARQLGQLSAVAPLIVSKPWDSYCRYQCARGRRLGDIKPAILSGEQELYTWFCSEAEKSSAKEDRGAYEQTAIFIG